MPHHAAHRKSMHCGITHSAMPATEARWMKVAMPFTRLMAKEKALTWRKLLVPDEFS
jgi:hypothetical protein